MNNDELKAIAAKSDAAMKRLDYAGQQVHTALNDPHAPGNIILADALAHVVEELKILRRDITQISDAVSFGFDHGNP